MSIIVASDLERKDDGLRVLCALIAHFSTTSPHYIRMFSFLFFSRKLDPNDPRNAHLIAQLNQAGRLGDAAFFRLRCDEVGEMRSMDPRSVYVLRRVLILISRVIEIRARKNASIHPI